jgi:two-component system sensor histidine kinase CpxA
MRTRFPLFAKIIAWFFLNLALLALIGLIFTQQKLRFGLDSLVAGPAGDRVRAIAVLIIQELTDAPRDQWNAILEKFGRESGVEFSLFAEAGSQIAGRSSELPAQVKMRLREGTGPPRPPRERNDGPPPDSFRPPPPQPQPPSRGPQVIGLMRAGIPVRYWTLIHAPLPQLGPEGPAVLILKSESLSAGGLIFDFAPLVWSAAAAIVISVLFWLPLVRGITRTVAGMRHATARIADGRFDVQLSADRNDELGALAASINRMSDRLSGLVAGQRRFLGDVAHELCAPLSRLQVALGILEERSPGAVDVRDLREEVDQIAELVNELLSFSRASLGPKTVELQPVNVREVLERALHREGDRARVEIQCDEQIRARANPDLLQRAVANLLRNAIRYAGHAGPIRIQAGQNAAEIEIAITDSGPGIPPEALPKIFDPFYRVDQSRTRDTGGVGLGLTIAKTCVEACGGTITVENIEPTGLRATIVLALPG